MMSTLTRMHHCHPHTSTLIATRKCDRMILFNGDKLCHWFVQSLATRTTGKSCIDWWCWNHNGNICWTLQGSLLGYTWISISLEVQRMIRRLIGILEFGLGLINLKGAVSVFL